MSKSIKDVSINFSEQGLVTGCAVLDLGDGVYKLLEHPLMSESAAYGDTIKAEYEYPEQLRFVEIIEKSDLIMIDALFPSEVVNNSKFNQFQEALSEQGIYWQLDFSGCFVCFVEPSRECEVRNLIEGLCT